MGLAVMSGATLILAMLFDLSAIASIGSAVALVVFTFVSLAHLQVRKETGARTLILIMALLTLVASLASFAATTLAEEPATAVALVVLLALAIALDVRWKRTRASGAGADESKPSPLVGTA